MSGISHTVPMLEDGFRKASVIQLEYLIVQFLQSNPTVLALRWLMNVYSLTNNYVKLSVGRLLEETMLILYRFTGTEFQDMDLNKLKHHNIGIDHKSHGQQLVDAKSEQNSKLNSTNILDITDSPARDIQPSHVINSLYLVQTLLRLEILETRKHFPGLIKCLPQLQIHVDTSMRDASHECLLSVLPLGVPGYSLSEHILSSLFSGVKILLEFDDYLNLKRAMQSISLILTQQPKLADVRKQEVLQLIVNVSSSLNSGKCNTPKTSDLIESISCLLAASTISQFSSSKKKLELYDSIHYIVGVSNTQFSLHGLGSYPIQGEYFRIIVASSVLKVLDSHALHKDPGTSQLQLVWSLLLGYLQTHFIRKHVTENLQWLTNNHWVFLWTQVLKKLLLTLLSSLQGCSSCQSSNMESYGTVIWTKLEQFLNPLAKISPRISLECTLGLVSSSGSANWIWKLNREFFELFLSWIFHISLTENFEVATTSYLSGHISAILVDQYYFASQDRPATEDIESIMMSYITFTREKIQVGRRETESNDFFEALIHNTHFLVGFSNSCSNPLIIVATLKHIANYLMDSPDIHVFSDPKGSDEKLFILNNFFLLVQNLLANIYHLTKTLYIHIETRHVVSRLYFLVPIWKNILSNQTIEKIVVVIESLAESCERFQLLLESKEAETWTIFDEDKENPVILLFKDLKQWLALLWTTIQSLHYYIELTEISNLGRTPQTETAKLERFLMKACFSIAECLLPCIPLSWTKFFPETKNTSLSSEISPELGSILSSPSSSLEDVGEYLRNLSFSKDSVKPPFGVKSKVDTEVFLQTIEKFTFPYIGDQNCFSRYIHVSALIVSLKLSVYRQLNKNLFSYINHPPVSNRSLVMLISDVASNPILILDPKIPHEVFTNDGLSDCGGDQSPAPVQNNDILAISEPKALSHQNPEKLASGLSLLESMKSYSSFPSILNKCLTSSNKCLEIHFREEAALLISNIISESHFLDQNNIFAHETAKNLFRILIKKSIHVSEFWSPVVSESQYYHQEDSSIKVQNMFPNYDDLSPSLFLMALKSLVSSPNDISVVPLVSIVWVFKNISHKIINKLNIFLSNSGSQIDQDHLKLINNSQDLLFFIFSFLIKFLFGYRYRDLKQQINYQNQASSKKLPPRTRSCVIRYYVLNLLAYLLYYFHNNKSIFSHYYYAKQKLEHLITWGNYSLSRTCRSNEDSESLTDLYMFFSILRPIIGESIDTELLHLIDTFYRDHANGSISERNKFFIYRVRNDIKFQNTLIETESDRHFGFSLLPHSSKTRLSLRNTSILDSFGEQLCFYSLRELKNIGIFDFTVELVHHYLELFLKSPSHEDLQLPRSISYASFNSIACVSLSLVFQSRIHEISFIDYHSLLYIPDTCKTLFSRDKFISGLWKFVNQVYLTSGIFSVPTRDLQTPQVFVKQTPYLNFLGLLITSSVFILKRTRILQDLSTQDFKILLVQDKNLISTLIEWILKSRPVHGDMSLSFLSQALKAMNTLTIYSLLTRIIRHFCEEFEAMDLCHSRNISRISSFLLDDENPFNISPFILYVQLKYSAQPQRDNSEAELDENWLGSILGANTAIVLGILEEICGTIHTKTTQVNTFDSLLAQEMVAYSFWSFRRQSLASDMPGLSLLGKVTRLMFRVLSSLLDLFETSIANVPYLESCILSRVLLVLKSTISIFPESLQVVSISEFSDTLDKMMAVLIRSEFKIPGSSDTTSTILEFFIQMYPSLSTEFKQRIWDIVLANTLRRLENPQPESLGSHLYLLFKLTETARLGDIKCLSQRNEQDLILVYGKTLDWMISHDSFDLVLVRHLAYIGFFVVSCVKEPHKQVKGTELGGLFSMKSLQSLVLSLVRGAQVPILEKKIHYLPSLVSVWNSFNHSTDFTKTIAEFLVYCYSSRLEGSNLQAALFYMEVVSCLRWLVAGGGVSVSSLRQDLSSDFETLAIRLFEGESDLSSGEERESPGHNAGVLQDEQDLTALVGMIYLFPLEVFNIEQDLETEEHAAPEGMSSKVVYLRVYQLLKELMTREEAFRDDYIQEAMTARLDKSLLFLYKGISLEKLASDSPEAKGIEREGYELVMGSMKFLVERLQFRVLVSTHLAWIEDEIKRYLMDFGGSPSSMDYYSRLIDMTIEILVDIQQFGTREDSEDNQGSGGVEVEAVRVIFQVFKYPLYCQIYSHPSYFGVFKSFALDHGRPSKEEDPPIPDLSGILRHHERLEAMILSKLESLLEKSSQYNVQVFELLVASLLPFHYSYSLEYGNLRGLVSKRSRNGWGILRNLVLNEKSKRNRDGRARTRETGLMRGVEAFLRSYLGILERLGQDPLSLVLAPCPVIAWFQTLFELEGREIVQEVEKENFAGDNTSGETETEFSRWTRLGDFYFPRDFQQISVELIPGPDLTRGDKELNRAGETSTQEVKELVEILGLVDA